MRNAMKFAATAGVFVLGLASYQGAFASPTGPSLVVEGGASYLESADLDNMSFPTSNTNGTTFTPTANYKAGVAGTPRAAFDYFFNNDPSNSWAYGIEGGYSYFFAGTSSATQSTQDPVFHTDQYQVGGTETSSAWSTDLDFLISEDISEHASLIYKIGAAYEDMSRQFTASTLQGPQMSPPRYAANTDADVSGFGGVLGLGMQYNFTKNFGMRVELDGMKGGENIGYAQALAGLTWSF